MLVRAPEGNPLRFNHHEIATQVMQRDARSRIGRMRHVFTFHVTRLGNGQGDVGEAQPHGPLPGIPAC